MEFRKMTEEEARIQEWLDEKMNHVPPECFGVGWRSPEADETGRVSWKLACAPIVLRVGNVDGEDAWTVSTGLSEYSFVSEAKALVLVTDTLKMLRGY